MLKGFILGVLVASIVCFGSIGFAKKVEKPAPAGRWDVRLEEAYADANHGVDSKDFWAAVDRDVKDGWEPFAGGLFTANGLPNFPYVYVRKFTEAK